MTCFRRTTRVLAASFALAVGLAGVQAPAQARVRHKVRRAAPVAQAAQPAPQPRQGVAGYFGPGAYGPAPLIGPDYGYYGPPRADLGFAVLGALNGGGLRGFVECGNYYARYPGACGF